MRVVLDACVLYPPSLRDLLLTLAALDAFDIRWSEAILEELRRNVVADYPDIDPDRFSRHTLSQMRQSFPEALAEVSSDDIDRLDNHPEDRHVAAVGILAGANAIVTLNVKDFGGRVLGKAGVIVLTPGELVDKVLQEAPELVVHAIRRISSRWKKPPRSPVEVVDRLAAHPTLADAMRRVRLQLR